MLVFGLSTKENEGPRMDNNDYKLYRTKTTKTKYKFFTLGLMCGSIKKKRTGHQVLIQKLSKMGIIG